MNINRLFTTIDTHAGGEPLRIITGGLPPIQGETMVEKRSIFLQQHDDIRRILLYEPRGHHGMYGCVITPPVNPGSAFGVLFMHNEGYGTLSGHGLIAAVTAAVETGMLQLETAKNGIVVDSPAGSIRVFADGEGNQVKAVSFENVPSFVFAQDVLIACEGFTFHVDIAFGGEFYAVVHAKDVGLRVEIEQLSAIREWAGRIKEQIEEKLDVVHPSTPGLAGIYGVIFSDEPRRPGSHLRNVTIFADKQVNRSPSGTGTAARMAVLYAKGELGLGERFVHEGIVGSRFIGHVKETLPVGDFQAVLPVIEGRAFITGWHQFVIDPADPLANGFLLR